MQHVSGFLLDPGLAALRPVATLARRSPMAVLLSALRSPASVVSALMVLRRLPVVQVLVGDGPAGRVIGADLRRRRLGIPTGRLARCVLDVPTEPASYPTGRHRQALRTNVRRAGERGTTTAVVTAADLPALAGAVRSDEWSEHLRWADRTIAPRGDVSCIVAALDAHGLPVALAAAVVDAESALLTVHISDQDSAAAADARYAVTAHLVTALAEAGVTYLIGESALSISPGLAYFQHLLGFRAVNVRPRRTASRVQRRKTSMAT